MDSEIDNLLELYLGLLDEYTKLRESLSATQRLMYHNIARANFSAERGMRYGPDHFDERMQATRKLRVEEPASAASPSLLVGNDADTPGCGGGGGDGRSCQFVVMREDSAPAKKSDGETSRAADSRSEGAEKAQDGDEGAEEDVVPARPTDPLRWFGLLTPAPLRLAQGQAVQLVEEVIPRLATVAGEMAMVEIEVRRARKKRAKAAAMRDKTKGEGEKTASGPPLAVS